MKQLVTQPMKKPMQQLYLANCAPLMRYPPDDARLWAKIYKLIPLNVSLVDRVGDFRSPFKFKLYDKFRLPTDLRGFKATYEECCARRAQELLDIQDRAQVPIALFYSGGIDSTLVLISFAKLLGAQLKNRVTVFLSVDSINENPNFYYSFVRKNCRIDSSEKFSYVFDGSHIVVGGEHNDQLFGSDIIGKIAKQKSFAAINSRYTRPFIIEFFASRGMDGESANAWFDILSEHAQHAPCAVETVFDFFWWFNFVFKWQSVYFRMLLRVNTEQHRNINRKFLDTYYHHFFSTDDFQKWSMLNRELKIRDSWKSYKFHAKELIYDFNKDRDYLENKTKAGSLYRLFVQKKTAIALTTDFDILSELDASRFYDSRNSFSAISKPQPFEVTFKTASPQPVGASPSAPVEVAAIG